MAKGEASYGAECAHFVLANLRDWEVDGIVDFGSHAKGEAVEGSDYDLAIYLHSDRLFLPKFIQESERFRDFMSRYPDLRFESTDLNSLLGKRWRDDKRVGSPLAPWGPWDIRWFAYRLAFETEGGNFLQLVCGQPLYDRGFYRGLIGVMRRDMPFHWNEGEESGIIDAFKRWCSAER
jgi:predicted nucleotidyltransferase